MSLWGSVKSAGQDFLSNPVSLFDPVNSGLFSLGKQVAGLNNPLHSPQQPAAPDYVGAANAQGQANLEAARISARLNNPNVTNPYGTQTVTWNGDQPNVTQTLSPEQQALYSKQSLNQGLLADLGTQGAQSLQGIVGRPVDFSGAPQTGNYEDVRKSVIDAMMSRANEDYGKQTDQSNSDLIAAGIPVGSKAYADRQQMIERSRNDARTQAEAAGGAEAARAYGIDADRRRQAIQEYLAQRQTPLNEISALNSGSQVTNPFAMPGVSQSSQVAPAPLFGAATAQGNYNTDIYNADVSQRNALMQGLFGLGGAAVAGSMGRR
jgi:hypothetical protein